MKTIQLIELPETRYADMQLAISKWGKTCEKVLEGRTPSTHASCVTLFRECQVAGHLVSGLRCHLLEYFQDETEPFADDPGTLMSAVSTLIELACEIRRTKSVQSKLECLESHRYNFEKCIHFVIAPEATTVMPFAKWRLQDAPGAIVRDTRVGIVRRSSRSASLLAAATATTDHCTNGQRSAIDRLVELIKIKRAGLSFAGWQPRTAALLVGPSGAGKSSVCPIVARKAELSLWTATTGSWTPLGSQIATSACNRLHAHLVENGPALIVVDETDKIRTRGDNANYYSSVFDEILALLDGRIGTWGWSQTAVDAFGKSHFIFSGAFQDLYARKLDGDVMFAGEVEVLTLSEEEIFGAGWLPAELLNRIAATVVEIKLPTCEEIEKLMALIDDAAGFKTAPRQYERAARNAVMSMRGLRAVEAHALNVARRKLAQSV